MATQPDQFTADGLNIVYRGDPNFAYGRSATASAQPFSNIVIHHTANDHDLDWYVNYGQTVDAERGGAFGYHFYIGPNGEIVQGAPLSARTNHILPTAEGVTARNNNSVGISIVGGDAGVTPAAQAAATRLGQALMQQYGIQPTGVFNHGELQPNDRAEEAGNAGLVNIVSALRGTPAPAPVAPVGPGGTPLMGYAGSPAPTGAAAAAAALGGGGGDGLPTIRNGAGSRGHPDENVRALQEFLNANGQNLQVDGVFGDMTERAVRAYQQENGLEVDGVVGPQTWGHIAGTAATAGGGEVSAIPGPVRGFVQRVFGDGAATNLASRFEAFRNGIRKGLSPTDAFTQARGQPIAGTPVAGSATAALPPKAAPVPPANPARGPAPVMPLPPANPARQPTQPAVAGDGLIARPTPKPVVGDGLVNRPTPPAPAPVTGDGMVNRPFTQPTGGPTVIPKPVIGDGMVDRAGPLPPMQRPLADPSLMPKGQPQSTVPTTPARNIGEGEYLPLEWRQLKQFETSRSQFPTYQPAPGGVPALIPNAPPRADAYSLKPLRRTEGPTQSGNPIFDAYPDRSGRPLRTPTGAMAPIIPGPQPGKLPMYEFPQAVAARAAAQGVDPAAIVAGMPKVSIHAAGWGPVDQRQAVANAARGIDPAAVVAGMGEMPVEEYGWDGPVDLRVQPSVAEQMRVAPAKTPTIPQPAPLPLVPASKSATVAKAPTPAPVVVAKAPIPPKPVIPVTKKKAA